MSSNQLRFICSPTAFQPTIALRATPGRRGLIINNPGVNYSGVALAANAALIGFSVNNPLLPSSVVWLQPGEKYTADYITPDDSLYLMSDTANANVILIEKN